MNLLAIIDVMAVMAYVYYTKLAYLQSEVLFQRIAVRSTKTSFQPGLVQILGWYIACYLDVEQTATLRGKLEVYTVILTNIILDRMRF